MNLLPGSRIRAAHGALEGENGLVALKTWDPLIKESVFTRLLLFSVEGGGK